MLDRVDPCLHLFLTSRLKDVKEHPYYATMFYSHSHTKVTYTRLCIVGLIMCHVKHDLIEKMKVCIEHLPFTSFFNTQSLRVQMLKKCILYKKIELAECILLNSNFFISIEDSLELGPEGYILYAISELKRMRSFSKDKEEISLYDTPSLSTTENEFEIDTVCFSIFREIEDKLNRTFLQDCMKHKIDPKSYLSVLLKTKGIQGLHPYLEAQLSEETLQLIHSYTKEKSEPESFLETIIEE